MPRQTAVVEQQVADGGADIEANRAEKAELGVDGLKAAFGDENRAAVDIAVQQRFGMGEEAMLERGHRQLQLGIVAQGGDIGFQRGWIAVALVNLIRVVKEQILGDFAHLGINKLRHLGLFLMRMQIKVAGVEQRLGQVFPQLAGGLGVVNVVDQLPAPDAVIGEIFHHHHRQLGIEMHNPHRVLRAVLMVSHQGLRLKARAVKGQRPGLSYAAHVGQRLLNDNPAHAPDIENFKHQVEVAVAHFLCGHQF